MRGRERAHDIVKGGFEVEDTVSGTGDPRAGFTAEAVDSGWWGGGSVALGFVFEEGDIMDADGKEGAETGRLAGEEVSDRERDVGEDRYVVDCRISYLESRGEGRWGGEQYRSCRLARQVRR